MLQQKLKFAFWSWSSFEPWCLAAMHARLNKWSLQLSNSTDCPQLFVFSSPSPLLLLWHLNFHPQAATPTLFNNPECTHPIFPCHSPDWCQLCREFHKTPSACRMAFLPASHSPSCKDMQDYLCSVLLWGTTAIKTWLPTQPGQLLWSWCRMFLSPRFKPEGRTNTRKASIDAEISYQEGMESLHSLDWHQGITSCPLHDLQAHHSPSNSNDSKTCMPAGT